MITQNAATAKNKRLHTQHIPKCNEARPQSISTFHCVLDAVACVVDFQRFITLVALAR